MSAFQNFQGFRNGNKVLWEGTQGKIFNSSLCTFPFEICCGPLVFKYMVLKYNFSWSNRIKMSPCHLYQHSTCMGLWIRYLMYQKHDRTPILSLLIMEKEGRQALDWSSKPFPASPRCMKVSLYKCLISWELGSAASVFFLVRTPESLVARWAYCAQVVHEWFEQSLLPSWLWKS